MQDTNVEKRSWWSTLPGIITGFEAIITAITGLIIALNQAGLFKNSKENKTIVTGSSQTSTKDATEKDASQIDNSKSGSIPEFQNMEAIFNEFSLGNSDVAYKILESVIGQADPQNSILKN